MSGLYNTLFGVNELADALLKCLSLTRADIPRFRDCYLTSDAIVIHTRTGGGNREDYEEGNGKLQAHPLYLYDEDDDFDSTYADFYFRFPKEDEEDLKIIAAERQDIKPSEKWRIFFKAQGVDVKEKTPQGSEENRKK